MFIRFLLCFVCFSLLYSQEKNIIVDAESLANIVMEVNELKEDNKKLTKEISFLKQRVLGTTKPFSVLKNGRYILPLVIRTPKIATKGIIDPLKLRQFREKISPHLTNAKIIDHKELTKPNSTAILQFLTTYTKTLPYHFWYSRFSFSLLRRDWENVPFRTKLYTKNMANKSRVYLAVKNSGKWHEYYKREQRTTIKASENYNLREFYINNTCLYAEFPYDIKTKYRYTSLFYEKEQGQEAILENPLALPGYALSSVQLHPQSIVLLEIEKNNRSLQKYIENIPNITVGPCFILPTQYDETRKKMLCFTLEKNRGRIDDISYQYTFEIDGFPVDKKNITVQKHLNYFIYRIWIPQDGKILTIRSGFLYKKMECNKIWPSIHLGKAKTISLPKLTIHISQFTKVNKKRDVLLRHLGMSRSTKKIDTSRVEEIKEFIIYLKTWNIADSNVNAMIQKLTQVIK
ncbi:hypothetical protein [Candidatus Uabimicrobium sp. HlEnr_7]|uniref:hypothetical protein n=1 Tax=Candidatus Uabimicrobium helgolandensis TaxID=3095367 RepID=UPI003558A61F